MRIKLTMGQEAVVDDDFAFPRTASGRITTYRAIPARTKIRKFYAARAVRKPDGSLTTRYLHHDVWDHYNARQTFRRGVIEIDHINGDSLDNRIANLREADRSLQTHTARRGKPRSGYVGVRRKGGRWKAEATVNGKRMSASFPGTNAGKVAAARQYDAWVVEGYGDAAVTNL